MHDNNVLMQPHEIAFLFITSTCTYFVKALDFSYSLFSYLTDTLTLTYRHSSCAICSFGIRKQSTLAIRPINIHSTWQVHLHQSVCFIFMTLQAHSEPRPLIQFRSHFSQTVGLLGRVISSLQCFYLYTE
jgi:hypothetical protein